MRGSSSDAAGGFVIWLRPQVEVLVVVWWLRAVGWLCPGAAVGLFEYTARTLDYFQEQLVHFRRIVICLYIEIYICRYIFFFLWGVRVGWTCGSATMRNRKLPISPTLTLKVARVGSTLADELEDT